MLDKIGTLKTPADIAQHLREEFAAGRGDAFNFYSNADFKDSQLVIAYADQGGLALPEKAYYLSDGSKAGDDSYKKIREAYVAHVSKQLQNAGIAAADADKQAKDVLAFETRLAKASLSPIEQRDPNNQYHFVKVADADKLSPNFPWSEFLKAQGVNVEGFSLSQPKFFAEFGKMVKDVPAEQWQAYFRAHLIDGMSPYLSDTFANEQFDFFGKTLRGQQEQGRAGSACSTRPKAASARRSASCTSSSTSRRSPRRRADKLVEQPARRRSRRASRSSTGWAPTPRPRRSRSGTASCPRSATPTSGATGTAWRSSRDSYVAERAGGDQVQLRLRRWRKVGKPVDRTEWGMTPQTVNAYYNPQQNEIVFPAAILQPPFFDPKADTAINYGGIGAVIGHEMHARLRRPGRAVRRQGQLRRTGGRRPTRRASRRAPAKLVKQFDDYVSIDGMHVKGKLTLGENIADLGGTHGRVRRAAEGAGRAGKPPTRRSTATPRTSASSSTGRRCGAATSSPKS